MPGARITGPSAIHHAPTKDDDSTTPAEEASASEITLRGALNEVVAFEYVLSADDAAYAGIEIIPADLKGPGGAITRDNIHIYRHWPITIDRYPNWYLRSTGLRKRRNVLDALVPIDAPRQGQPFTIARGEQLVLWVELKIPANTNVGRYTGDFVVRSASGGARKITVQLDVLDLFVEPERNLPVVAYVQLAPLIRSHTTLDPDNARLVASDPDARRLITETFRLLHDHGVTPVTTDIHPRVTQNIDGRLVFDWEDYDAVCAPFIDGSAYADRRPAGAWPLPVDLRHPDASQYGGPDATTYAGILKEYLAGVAAHFRERGWFDHAFVSLEPPARPDRNIMDYDRVRRMANLVHLAEPAMPFASRQIPQSMIPFGWFGHPYQDLSSVVDIWATPARYQHPATLRRMQMLGKRTWLPPDHPPYSGSIAVEAPPTHARGLAWQAFLQGHDAILIDHATDWPRDIFDHPIQDRRQPSDTWLVYPGLLFGLDNPVPSLRLKQIQLGLQDHQRLRLLESNGRGETARLVAGSLIKAAGTDAYGDNYQDGLLGRRIDKPQTWELGRHILDDELLGALKNDPRSPGGAPREDWVRFLSETRTIEAWIESTRLRFDDRAGQEGWLLTLDVGVRSELRTPVEGELRFGDLPWGTKVISDTLRLGPLQEWGVERRQLAAKSSALPVTNLDGHYTQPLVFDAGASGHVDIAATVSIAQVPPATLPITIDGRLNDWPPSAFNAAGDFRLVTNRNGAGRERPRAESQTIVYFLEADRVLYIGIHAASPKRGEHDADIGTALRNFVEYEDLMPVGEDLVEIILDPTNRATQSGDLYHLVVKSSGNPRFERGIDTQPPIGEVRAWPGDMPECCVTRTEFGWSAELAIPMSVFGLEAEIHRSWGINIARLEPIRGEYSDWARAPRYCYDPRSLGSLVWPE